MNRFWDFKLSAGVTKVSGTVVFPGQVQRQNKKNAEQADQADPDKRRGFGVRRFSAALIVCRSSRRLSGPLILVVGRWKWRMAAPQTLLKWVADDLRGGL